MVGNDAAKVIGQTLPPFTQYKTTKESHTMDKEDGVVAKKDIHLIPQNHPIIDIRDKNFVMIVVNDLRRNLLQRVTYFP